MFRDNINAFKTLGIIAVVIVFIYAIFNSGNTTGQEKQALEENKNTENSQIESALSVQNDSLYTLPEAYIDDQIVFKVIDYSESASKITLKLYFENNSEDTMWFNTESIRINDVTIGGDYIDNSEWLFGDIAFRKELAAHKRANVELYIEKNDIKKHGISSIGQIGLICFATNQEDYKVINIPYMAIDFSNKAESTPEPIKAVVYEDEKIRVDYIGIDDDSFKFRIYNRMDQALLFILREVNINDFGYGDIYSAGDTHVYAQTYYDFSIPAPSDFCQVNGINELKKVDYRMEVIPVIDLYKKSFSVTIEAEE